MPRRWWSSTTTLRRVEPSRDDLGLTRRLVDGGTVLGVSVHDHLIVAGARWLSLRAMRPRLFEAAAGPHD
jgi:hypothetical protein